MEFDQEDFRKEKLDHLDYKMVTFTLGGKDFGIDIMKVKEISKANRFTYVPNAAPYVRGVYNLRGDIISIIDLRVMFNVPRGNSQDAQGEQMIILRLENNVLGVIVDSIDKVVGINSKTIQPPHPIFGDINIQFISGIVENDRRLYLILDVDRIFSQEKEEETSSPASELHIAEPEITSDPKQVQNLDYTFISESLATFMKFHVSNLNEEWIKLRVEEWRMERQKIGRDVQIQVSEEAEVFLSPFYSPFSGILWDEDFRSSVKSLLPDTTANVVNLWNPGCASGLESYSLATIAKEKYAGKRTKIWAYDNNLLEISTAPAMVLNKAKTPACYDQYLTETSNGLQFSTEIKEMILFEYHDIVNDNHVPPMDVVVARDLLSFLNSENQMKLISEIKECMKPGGLLLLGRNELLDSPDWKPVGQGKVRGYIKL
ncbi:MAG: chemotaxis protein CheW [Spirochaetales bacterium]|nr:chemotaxis protein CheW [Spirochaetales bacterium]